MTLLPFSLKPFAPEEAGAFSINGSVCRKNGALHLSFTLRGPLQHLQIPLVPGPQSQRMDNLWQQSCFECFFAGNHSEIYWEINLTPNGNWNVYRFECYRQGMQEEKNLASLPCRIICGTQQLVLQTKVDLECMGLTGKTLHIGASAVLLSKRNNLSYWALDHCGKKPDFHDRKGFTLSL